jgi:hypothetical protein
MMIADEELTAHVVLSSSSSPAQIQAVREIFAATGIVAEVAGDDLDLELHGPLFWAPGGELPWLMVIHVPLRQFVLGVPGVDGSLRPKYGPMVLKSLMDELRAKVFPKSRPTESVILKDVEKQARLTLDLRLSEEAYSSLAKLSPTVLESDRATVWFSQEERRWEYLTFNREMGRWESDWVK